MSTVKTNVADYLAQIEKLTNTNLQILKTINDSFFTKKNHLFAEIDDTTYVMPSFLSLENKINMLQENFENLVKSPETGEAYFNFNGNTRAIEVKKYSYTPNPVSISTVENFSIENNDIFKDFLTPMPYINIEMPELTNDITEVNVKKIIPKVIELQTIFENLSTRTVRDASGTNVTTYYPSVSKSYADIRKILSSYTENVDYIEYDTVYKLPVKKCVGTGTYVIESVIEDHIDNNLDEFYTIKLRNNLLDTEKYSNTFTYKLFDNTIERSLHVGDELINYDGSGKVVITELRPKTNTMVVKVVNGEYLNFIGTDSYDTDSDKDIHDLSKLRFYSPVNFDDDKIIKLPLEEDPTIYVAVAPLNSRLNIQGPWGTGLIVNTFELTNSLNNYNFKKYYEENVKNIGDVLYEMTTMISSPITQLLKENFDELKNYKPFVDTSNLMVMQINKHLNNSTNIKNIRNSYNQKKTSETELENVENQIISINNILSSVSFADTEGVRDVYTSQLKKLNERKNELVTNINNAINEISINANSSEIPIENAKYRIRGYYIPTDFVDNIIGLKVQYRYKNAYSEVGNATSISGNNGQTYIYSDWNNLNTYNKTKLVEYSDEELKYVYKYENNNETVNEPSYNQIDIPISQGESVDIRLKLIYDYGQPYVTLMSDWSEIVTIDFPEEFTKDVPILTIIDENNDDIETNRFNSILNTSGINTHISDSTNDQNITYFHKADNIASGFYTEERRIIPLRDKLVSMTNDIAELKNSVMGASGNYTVSVNVGENTSPLYSDRDNTISLESYNNFITLDSEESDTEIIDGVYSYNKKTGVVSTVINISIENNSDSVLKLYSLFPGSRSTYINNSTSTYFNKTDYCEGESNGIWIKSNQKDEKGNDKYLQSQNQFITFRMNDLWTGKKYYKSGAQVSENDIQNSSDINSIKIDDKVGLVIYPYVNTRYGLCIDSDDIKTFLTLNPGEELVIPMLCLFKADKPNSQIHKTISFDLRTSLYSDPINYTFTVIGKNLTSVQDKLTLINKNKLWDRLTKKTPYTTIIK
jgi:hypothetical protein